MGISQNWMILSGIETLKKHEFPTQPGWFYE